MARVLPGPFRTTHKIVCQPGLPKGDLRKYMTPKVVVKDIGVLISKVCPRLDITQGVGAHNVGTSIDQFHFDQHSPSPSPSPPPLNSPYSCYVSESSYEDPLQDTFSSTQKAIPRHSDKFPFHNEGNVKRIKTDGFSISEKHSSRPLKPINCNSSAPRLKPQNIPKHEKIKKIGFLGFPEEDSRKLKKTRFHVNTNILASSLDLLDLHKHSGMRTGSPMECGTCGITFPTVRHCKYHQSVCSSHASKDPARFHNVKGDGMWLCPWCPVVCLTVEYLSKHKVSCRERGRCFHDSKATSQRKPITNLSKRRNSVPSSGSIKNDVLVHRSNSFKVVHGQVIPHKS